MIDIEKIRESLALTSERDLRRERALANAIYAVSALALLGTAVGALKESGVFLNITPSMPLGLYREEALPPLRAGMIVLLCPPSFSTSHAMRQAIRRHWLQTEAGSPCQNRLVPFLKRIAAVPGQQVKLSMTGISVDGHMLPATAIKARSKAGRPIIHYPLGRYTVRPGHVWLTDNSSPWAYDSRYWGPVTTGHLLAAARPVLTW